MTSEQYDVYGSAGLDLVEVEVETEESAEALYGSEGAE